MNKYIYTYASHEDEAELCRLELSTLFGSAPGSRTFCTNLDIDPSRSPYVKARLERLAEGGTMEELAARVHKLGFESNGSFKLNYMKTGDDPSYAERLSAEREVGRHVRGIANMRHPDKLYGITRWGGRWHFGHLRENEAVWLKHNDKPQHYSTALPTRVARAVANIAAPNSIGVKVIDPCCGIGTVLVEALSMKIDIVGFDLNWMAVRGARANLAHFGMPDVVKVADIRTLEGRYDAAILDVPYNLCSKLSQVELLEILQSAGRLAPRIVIVTAERIDDAIEDAALKITDRCVVAKGRFSREVLVCVSETC